MPERNAIALAGGKEAPASRKKRRIVRRVAPFAVAGLLLLTAGAAVAQGPPVVNQTDHIVNETSTAIDVHPCTGQPAELTLTENGVIHEARSPTAPCT